MPHDPGNSQPTIMVVEDFEDTRRMIALELRRRGYQVTEASNGREAVEFAKRDCPDLVVMDLSLPVMDGLSAVYRMREVEAMCDVPVIACSAHGADTHLPAAEAVGCDEYLSKPVEMPRLVEAVGRLLAEGRKDGGRKARGLGETLADEELTDYIDGLIAPEGR